MAEQRPHISIGLCTFRRPHVRATLESLGSLNLPPNSSLSVIVVDNDKVPSGREAVDAAQCRFPLEYLHAPKFNISIARNAVLTAAKRQGADYLAFIDDDEIVTANWLIALRERLEESGEAVAVGPVQADYLPEAAPWLKAGRFHDTAPDVDSRGIAHTGYTCNVLLDLADPRLCDLSFDISLGRSGGEDSAYFATYQKRGGHIAYAEDALVCEVVPKERASLNWLMRRRYRMGQTHGAILSHDQTVAHRFGLSLVAAAKAAYCFAKALFLIASPEKRNKSVIRGTLHCGVISGYLGQKAIEIYGESASART